MQDLPRTIEQAKLEQERLRGRVETRDRLKTPQYVAGTDVSYQPGTSRAKAAWAVLQMPGLEIVDRATAVTSIDFPYVPGFLSFREIPPLLEAFSELNTAPGLIVCDGQGIAHPKRFGLACHLGVILDIPAVGAAKSKLVGDYTQPELLRGNWSPLVWQGHTVGAALCTKNRTKPLFVSSGHRISLQTSIDTVLKLGGKYKLPETTRAAHALSKGL